MLPLLICGALIALLYSEDLDQRVTALFFDESTGEWPWRAHWLTKSVLHDGGTDLIGILAAICLAISLFAGLWPARAPLRRPAFYLFLCIVLSSGLIAVLKSISPDPTPWDAARFGGSIVHGRLFMSVSQKGELGHGSPAAFASGGFALMGLYYCLRGRNLRRAWLWLLVGWCIGNVYGATQVVRGAHYPSHNYWSAALVWILCTALYWGPFRGSLERAGRRGIGAGPTP